MGRLFMKLGLTIFSTVFVILACAENRSSELKVVTQQIDSIEKYNDSVALQEMTPRIVQDIKAPKGYNRIIVNEDYSTFIRNLPIRATAFVETYTGDSVAWNSKYKIDKGLLFSGNDLEQCADWAMRLWADYHKQSGKIDTLFLFEYSGKKKQYGNGTYESFLKTSFAYSNSFSLKSGARRISLEELIPGDMIVQNEDGGIGHVSVILDVIENSDGERLYLIGYSFMPAQEMHIDYANSNYGVGGWYSFEGFEQYLNTYIPVGKPELRRF